MTRAILTNDEPKHRKRVGKKPYAVECLPHRRWLRKGGVWSVWGRYETPEAARHACEALNRTKARFAEYRLAGDTQ